ncbi:L3HYPDH (predicted) [Pycnogonum litorale]
MAMQLKNVKIKTCEMHTGGEPLRIVESGIPEMKGDTILAKRSYAKENLDDYRKLIMFEPRGHYDMYGAILVKPDDDADADMGVLFIHNEGYSVMCGHAIIALGRYAVDHGFVKPEKLRSPQSEVRIQCPCGPVTAYVDYDGKKSGNVKFHSVGAFAYAIDYKLEVEGHGQVLVDIGYGGTFYAVLPASRLGLDVRKSRISELVEGADLITETAKKRLKLSHPHSSDLAFLYGTILTDGRVGNDPDLPSANVCIYADSAVDRSPTGSGVTTRTALEYKRGNVDVGETCTYEGLAKSKFATTVVSECVCGDRTDCVIVEVSGRAYYSGQSTFTVEEDDPVSPGFLIR